MISDPSVAYRASAWQTANPVRLVILLYEQIIKDLQKAASAMTQNQVQLRAQEIDHALIVVGKLQDSLDMERGGDVARNLDRFYDVLRGTLIDAQARLSPEILLAQVRHLLALREAWIEVERAGAVDRNSASSPMPAPREPQPESAPHGDWKV